MKKKTQIDSPFNAIITCSYDLLLFIVNIWQKQTIDSKLIFQSNINYVKKRFFVNNYMY